MIFRSMYKSVKALFNRYRSLPKATLNLIKSVFILSLVNGSFILILNIYMSKAGFLDHQIGNFTSYRFLGVLILAFPFGIYIKGKRLKPYFLMAALIIPLAGFIMIQAVAWQQIWLIKASFLTWGLGLMLLNVCSLPFIMRTTPKSVLSEAITLNFSMWSLAIIFTGIGISILNKINKFALIGRAINVSEYHMLLFFIILSTSSIYFILKLDESPPRSDSSRFKNNFRNLLLDYDWFLMIKALVPTLLIAVGAGLTIPFINLFFFSVFNLDSGQFSILGSAASFLSFGALLLSPTIKRRYGYNKTILLTQFIAVTLLIILSLTQLFSFLQWMIIVAIVSYLLRQPLMHMAAPITSELTMKYVGEKNQELVSAINYSIWSASWFLSAKIFQILRSIHYPYYKIFLITALLYAIGVIFYYFIIREYEMRSSKVPRDETFEHIIYED